MEEKILLVDDDSIIREVISDILEAEGYQVMTGANGVEALDILGSAKDIGVVICDIKMPKMGGEEVLRKIHFLYPLIPVIMLTGFVDLETALEVMRRGAFDYLAKPVDDDRLLDLIKKALAHRDKMKKKFENHIKREKMAAVGKLLTGIVHNLNNPLTTISGYTELLQRKYPENEALKKISIQISRMNEIIDNMMYKTSQGQNRGKKAININRLLTEELKFLEADLNFKHNIEKVVDLNPSLPEIIAEYNDLSQSFLNVIENSVDAMYRSKVKRLTITTVLNNGSIMVKFGDTGDGIKEEDIPRLFDPFFTTKPLKGEEEGKPTGTGLGLYSCYQLLQPYGANFEIKSKVGKGTDFSILLPINKEPMQESCNGTV